METEALRTPVALGVNVTEIVHCAVAASVAPQVVVREKSPEFVPVMVMLVMFRVAVPLLVRVMFSGEELVPTDWLLKVRLVGEKFTPGAAGGMPVPVRDEVCGLPAALSVIENVPLRVPVVVGVKVTFRVQLLPAVIVIGTDEQVPPLLGA
jgi:hypothetical protein